MSPIRRAGAELPPKALLKELNFESIVYSCDNETTLPRAPDDSQLGIDAFLSPVLPSIPTKSSTDPLRGLGRLFLELC
jgi:hypothetical protein